MVNVENRNHAGEVTLKSRDLTSKHSGVIVLQKETLPDTQEYFVIGANGTDRV